MERKFQDNLNEQLQRLFTLLNVKSGIYNVESRVCSNGKAYIMEVSPRGGGNRIAELQDMATGQSLIRNEIRKALALSLDDITTPKYDGVWCNYILHSNKPGTFVSVDINPNFEKEFIRDIGLIVKKGDKIAPFTGANTSLGTLFLQFKNRAEADRLLSQINRYITIRLEA